MRRVPVSRWGRWADRLQCVAALAICFLAPHSVVAQAGVSDGDPAAQAKVTIAAANRLGSSAGEARSGTRSGAAGRFLRGRTLAVGTPSATGLAAARGEHAAMVQAQIVLPRLSVLNGMWQPVGPGQVASLAYGKISGRVSSVAIDPADATGNTVYIGTTGGGVWKSTNAAGPKDSVTFQPLTDNLPVFSGAAGSAATASLSIGAISAQTGGIVLAGTGDPNDASDSYYGSGILRSADGGLTWSLIPGSQDGLYGQHSFSGLGFAGFAWSTANPGLVVAALSQSAEGAIVNAVTKSGVMGLYVSTDNGATWAMATILDGTITVQTPTGGGGVVGVAATSVVWNPVRQRFYAAIRNHGYYESTDGASWKRLLKQPGTGLTSVNCPALNGGLACPIFRGELAVQPVSGDLFAITTDHNNVDQGVWQDVCAPTGNGCSSGTVQFANRLPSSALEVGSGSMVIAQADYNLSLAAQPAGADTVLYVGTGDLFRCSLEGGCTLRNTTNATNGCAAPAMVAPSQHAIATSGSAGLVYVGNDGGLWRSTDGVGEQGAPCSADDVNHFQNLNGGLGSLAEVVSLAQDPSTNANLLVGLGASGTASSTGNTAGAWPQVSTGEGGTVAIDQSNPSLWYVSTAGGVSLRGCASGARCTATDFTGPPTIGASQTSLDASLTDAPWILDPVMSSSVLIGTCRVWRGAVSSGDLWSGANQLSAMLGGPQNMACDPTTNPFVRSLAAGGVAVQGGTTQNTGSAVLYAGMAGVADGGGAYAGHIFSTTRADLASGATRWTDLASSPVPGDVVNSGRFNPSGFDISSLATDPHDATGKTIYATVMGFSGNGVSAPHLYGSTDGGAHWQALSSNLPNAPANSVVVDPNDANTVYVALDTGVYVTTRISSCTTANCWSVYGVSLPNAPVIQLLSGAGLSTNDGRVGMLRAGTYGRGVWEIPLLTATYPAQPAMTLSPAALSFADQAMNSASAAQTITVTNTGAASLVVSRVAVTGDFAVTDTCAGSTVAVNASCMVKVEFLPTAQGARTGVLTVYGNVSGGQATAALGGNGTSPGSLVSNPLSLSFAATMVGSTSAGQNVTVSNIGGALATLQAATVSGDFTIGANTCGGSLAASTGCTIAVVFTPTAAGSRYGRLNIAGNSGTLTVPLSGAGTSPATDGLSLTTLSFTPQETGTSSAVQQVVLTNTGDVSLTLVAAQISSGDFIAVDGCGASLNAHSTCAISVSYAPKSVGAEQGVLLVSDQFRTQRVGLTGTGVAPPGISISPSGPINFAATAVGGQSAVQSVTLTNNGGLPLTLQSISLSGDFASAAGGSCGAVLAPSTSCTIMVVFAPSAGGTRTGSLTIFDNAPTSPQTELLAGVGVDFTLAADGSTSATIASGKNATYPLLLQSTAGMSGTATFACTGAPANATCVISPGSASLGTSALITVTVATGVAQSVAANRGTGYGADVVWVLAGAGPIGLLTLRRRRVATLLGIFAMLSVGAAVGCGSGRTIPVMVGPTTPGVVTTPAGSYTVTVTASSAGLTRAINLNLTVQ